MEKDRTTLMAELADLIVESVNLKHVQNKDLTEDMRLTLGGLELDSIDILELVVTIEQKYGIKIRNAEVGQKVFQTVGTLADYIQENKTAG